MPRIGYLTGATPDGQTARIEAFRQGLRDLGYIEGQNIAIEYRYAEGKRNQLPSLAADLIRLKVDIIVTGGGGLTRTVKSATSTIPIVMTQDGDPVANGFVASLARPGGNITGLSNLAPQMSGKQLEILKEIIPKLARVAVFGSSASSSSNAQQLKELELAAEPFKVNLQYIAVVGSKDIDAAFGAAAKGRADAIIVQPGPIFNSHRTRTAKLALERRLPVM